MTFNPPLTGPQTPHLSPNESIILSRPGISFTLNLPTFPSLFSSGTLLISTQNLFLFPSVPKRLNYYNYAQNIHSPTNGQNGQDTGGTTFQAFGLPLKDLYREKFQQPVFGCNYFEAKVRVMGERSGEEIQMKIYFKSGGAGIFLPVMSRVLFEVRVKGMQESGKRLQEFKNLAVADPSDPSIVYLDAFVDSNKDETGGNPNNTKAVHF